MQIPSSLEVLLEALIEHVELSPRPVEPVRSEHGYRLYVAAKQFAEAITDKLFPEFTGGQRQIQINLIYDLFSSGAAWAAMDILTRQENRHGTPSIGQPEKSGH